MIKTLKIECAPEVRANCENHLVRCATCVMNGQRDSSNPADKNHFRAVTNEHVQFSDWAIAKQQTYTEKLRTAYITLLNLVELENGYPEGMPQASAFDKHVVLTNELEAWKVFGVYDGLYRLKMKLVDLLKEIQPKVMTDDYVEQLKLKSGQNMVAAQIDEILFRVANTKANSPFQRVAANVTQNVSFALLLEACEEPLTGGVVCRPLNIKLVA